MNAEPVTQLESMEEPTSAEPVYFSSGIHTLFGMLHRPAGGARAEIGLVICKPFGYEAVCAHRSTRAFAAAAAALGVPALRFDYAGCGDSQDLDPQAEQIAVWSADVLAAVEELRRRSGVERVCLLGIRLGALLASLAAAQTDSVAALVAIAPVLSGRRYLRELRAFQAASQKSPPSASARGNETRGHEDGTGTESLEVTGFAFSPASIARLAKIDLTQMPRAPCARALLIDRSDLPAAAPWAEALKAVGVSAQLLSLPGYVEMVTTPHATVIPAAMQTALCEFLLQLQLQLQSRPPSAVVPLPRRRAASASSAALLQAQPQDGSGALLGECACYFGPDNRLFGIVSEPPIGEARRRGVVLINGGATYHIGPNRMYVALARHWARRGYVVLRLDLAGLGDSGCRPGQSANEVYPPDALEDIQYAMQFLGSRYEVREITLGGLCAGAYHALRAAVAGLPVNRILMVNPLTFYWEQGMTLNDLQLAEIVHNPGVYRERVMSLKSWRKLLTGRVNVWRIIMIYWHRLWLAVESRLRDQARRLHIRLAHDLGWELEELAARGVRIVFVFARGDTGAELLKIQAGSSVRRLGEYCRVHVIDGADHIFSQSQARGVMEQVLSEELFVRQDESCLPRAIGPVAGDADPSGL